jgi:hypothetical protein
MSQIRQSELSASFLNSDIPAVCQLLERGREIGGAENYVSKTSIVDPLADQNFAILEGFEDAIGIFAQRHAGSCG